MDKIRIGSFVRLENHFGDKFWCEVMQINRPLMSSESKPEQTYYVRYWLPKAMKWEEFVLSPEIGHKDFITEVLNLDPAVAKIFRETLKDKE